jgi:hypothetical protein
LFIALSPSTPAAAPATHQDFWWWRSRRLEARRQRVAIVGDYLARRGGGASFGG